LEFPYFLPNSADGVRPLLRPHSGGDEKADACDGRSQCGEIDTDGLPGPVEASQMEHYEDHDHRQKGRNMVNFDPLAAEIGLPVWGTPANFNGFNSRLDSVTYCTAVN